MAHRTLTVAAALAALLAVAGCSGTSMRSATTVTVTATQTAASASASTPVETLMPTAASPTKASPTLRPGPRSAVAEIDLPEGTTQCSDAMCDPKIGPSQSPNSEDWQYTVPFESLIPFLSNQFADGPQYDAHGTTSWLGLPPCYYQHHPPPIGGTAYGDNTWVWVWGKGSQNLEVLVDDRFHTIRISRPDPDDARDWNAQFCLRS